MPAPTALLRKPEELSESLMEDVSTAEPVQSSETAEIPFEDFGDDTEMNNEAESHDGPKFTPAPVTRSALKVETRKVPVPPHRMTPLKKNWTQIYTPLIEHLRLQVRMNVARKVVELRTSPQTTEVGALQQGEDFVKAFVLGFEVEDAIALIRIDDLYVETFEVKDVKNLQGEHLSRAIGRIAGKDGKTKFAIENSTRTRVVLKDSKIHILGGFQNTRMAREAIVSLILGAPPGKVYGNLRTVASRMKDRF